MDLSVMDLLVERVDVWAATIQDRPGGLSEVLDALRQAGANLQSVIARRAPDKPGTGVVFVTPLQNDMEIRAAAQVGFNVSQSLHSVSVWATLRGCTVQGGNLGDACRSTESV